MNNKKGFTLVELLVAIVVLMIISGLSITAYFKYINQAKQVKDKENVSLVENAAKSYLKSNSILLPREIGESKKVLVSELKDQNYITDAIVNSKGKECLDDSYVIVTKKSNSDYSYDVHIYYDESEKLISSTEDYVPNVGEFITIDDVVYEVTDKKVEIVALHTEIEIHLAERQHNMGI